jgi:hypothetical protein
MRSRPCHHHNRILLKKLSSRSNASSSSSFTESQGQAVHLTLLIQAHLVPDSFTLTLQCFLFQYPSSEAQQLH